MTPWQSHLARWKECQECPLCAQRGRIVLARGDVPADVLLVGEAPGQSEDVLGLPFVGPAGKILDQIVERAVPAEFTKAYTNLVACFPAEAKQTENHQPTDDEIRSCQPRLREFVEIVRPRLIVTVGQLSTDWAPKATAMIELRRGDRAPKWCSITHPAAILRMPLAQREMAARRAIAQLSSAIRELKAEGAVT